MQMLHTLQLLLRPTAIALPVGLLACGGTSGIGPLASSSADGGAGAGTDGGAGGGDAGPKLPVGDASSSVDASAHDGSFAGDSGADAGASPAGPDAAEIPSDASVSYTLKFVAGSDYNLYASIGGGAPHEVQLDTGSNGLYVPKSMVGAGGQISATDTCSVTYVSSGNTLAGHKATGPVTLLGSTTTGDVPNPPTTVSMSFCAVDDATFTGGMMGVGFGRSVSDPTQNVLLQMADIPSGAMHAGYFLSTHPSGNVQIGITSARAALFQTIQLSPNTTGNGDWVATSLKGCLTLPNTPAFAQECGGLLVDTGVAETILWGPTDPTLGGLIASGATTVPSGTAVQVTTQAGAMLKFSFVIGSGADTPSAVDIKTSSAFSINTGRALIVDYDYMFDAVAGLVGFEKM